MGRSVATRIRAFATATAVLAAIVTCSARAHAGMVLEFYQGTTLSDASLNVGSPLAGLSLAVGQPDKFVQIAVRQTAGTTLLDANDGLAAYLVQGVYGANQSGTYTIAAAVPGTGTTPLATVGTANYALVRAYRTGVGGDTPGGTENTATAFRFGGLYLSGSPSPSVDANGRIYLGTFQVHAVAPGISSIAFPDPNSGAGTVDFVSDNGDNLDAVLFNGATYTLPITVLADPAIPTASASAANVTVGGGTTHEIHVTYSDDVGMNTSTMGTDDLSIPGLSSLQQLSTSANGLDAFYTFGAPGGSWDPTDNGNYTITMNPNSVFDSDTPTPHAVPGGTIGSFTVNIQRKLVVSNVSQAEGNSGTTNFTFTVALSYPAGLGGVTFDVETQASSATAPDDFEALTLTGQNIPEGSSSKDIIVTVKTDTQWEPDEVFSLLVDNVSGVDVIVLDDTAEGKILNDDRFELQPFLNPNVVGDAAFGDVHDDGLMDLLVAAANPYTGVFRNVPGFGFPLGQPLTPPVFGGSVAWADYDNDDDLDAVVTGYQFLGVAPSTILFRNTAGTLAPTGAPLQGVARSAAKWGDYDNDGDLDLLLSGAVDGSGFVPSTTLYRNDHGVLVPSGIPLQAFTNSAAAWGDYDGDGDLDLAITGDIGAAAPAMIGGSGPPPSTIDIQTNQLIVYRNNGGTFAPHTITVGVQEGDLAWADYDNDGDLDFVMTGLQGGLPLTRIFTQNVSGVFLPTTQGLPDASHSRASWGDYDNDGDLDLALMGIFSPGGVGAKVFINNAGTFTADPVQMPAMNRGAIHWADVDNDRDLDLFLFGVGTPFGGVFLNKTGPANAAPAAPTGLSVATTPTQATLSWTGPADDHTATSELTYNLRIGTSPGGSQIMSAMANNATGLRKLPAMGNTQLRHQWTIVLPPGVYYWSVQAIDGAYQGSAFAPEQSFTTLPPTIPSVIETRIAASNDDAEQRGTSVDITSSDLELTEDGTAQTVGIRFRNLAIPHGAAITKAYVQFQADETQSGPMALRIEGQAADSALAFVGVANNVSSRARTTAFATWSPVDWTTIGQAGDPQKTTELKDVIQEIVGRAGWKKGNALALLITGTGHRTAESYDGSRPGAPLLHVEFEISTDPNQVPVVDAGPPQSVTSLSALLDGSVSDDGLPVPPGSVTTTWEAIAPPNTVSFGNDHAVDTQATFGGPGTYLLRLTASDGAKSASDDVTITVLGAAPIVVERRIAAGSDDAEESASGSVDLSSSDLELVYDGSLQMVGLRFTNLAIPRGAVISNAWVQFQADETQSEVPELLIGVEAADNSAPFTSASHNLSSRALGAVLATWQPPAWTAVGLHGAAQQTPNIPDLIRTVVGRNGWASGNALSLFILTLGPGSSARHRTAESFEGLAAAAPLLHVEYTTGAPANQPPTVNAGTTRIVTVGATIVLDGTATDDGIPTPAAPVVTWSVDGAPTNGHVSFSDVHAIDPQASFDKAGTYILRLTASDGVLQASDVAVILALPAGTVVPFEARVSAGADDAEESSSGTVSLTSSDLELVLDTSLQTVGLRFRSVGIPPGATILNAWVQFQTDEITTGACNLTIQGQASDDAAVFTTAARNISMRPRTTEAVAWPVPDWNVPDVATDAQKTPDLSALIQAIVNRGGWASGRALALIITGTGRRTAEAFEGVPAAAPLLHVEYTAPTVAGRATADPLVSKPITVTGPTSARVVPNPLREGGAFELALGKSGAVRVELFDLQGRRVQTLVDGRMLEAGVHRFALGARLGAGVYFYRVSAPDRKFNGRVMVLE